VACARTWQQLDDALLDLHRAARPALRPLVAHKLAEVREEWRYPDGFTDETEDILNRVLVRVGNSARGPDRYGGRARSMNPSANLWRAAGPHQTLRDPYAWGRRLTCRTSLFCVWQQRAGEFDTLLASFKENS